MSKKIAKLLFYVLFYMNLKKMFKIKGFTGILSNIHNIIQNNLLKEIRGEVYMAVHSQNMSVDTEVYADFCKYSEPKGIKFSSWLTIKMREFVEAEILIEEFVKNKK